MSTKLDGIGVTTVAASAPADWAVIGAAVAALAALITLTAAAINFRTARTTARAAAARPASAAVPEPKVLLPARAHFVDRHDELRTAMRSIRAGEMAVAIEGGIGVGKSAAATELAWRLRSGQPNLGLHDHAFVWIDARDRVPSLADICRPLSLLTSDQSLSAAADDEKLDALRAHLASNRTVLVLDNLRLGDDPASEALRDLVRSVPGGSLVIASVNRPTGLHGSRVALGDLDDLHVRELVRYQVQRLGLPDGDAFDDAFAERLHTAIGGNPRMIEWFLRALSRSGDSLNERLAAVESGEGLTELFAPVWRHLGADERTVLAACAHLRGEAIADQLVVTCALPADAVAAALERLIDEGLVVAVRISDRPSAYTCSVALQRFVLAATDSERRNAFTAALAAHYTQHFTREWEDAPGAVAHVGALRVVIQDLFAREEDEALLALFGVTLDILFTLGLFDDRIALGALAYESGVRAGDFAAASRAAEVVSSTHAVRGETAAARRAVATGLAAAERSELPSEMARQRRCDGFVMYRAGDAAGALVVVEGADELARVGDDLETLVNVLELRAAAQWYLGALDACASAAEACLAVCEEMPWERAKAYPLRHLAEVAIHRGDVRQARELLDAARSIADEYADRRHGVRLDVTEARLHLLSSAPREARALGVRAQIAARRLRLPPEAREARALAVAGRRAALVPPLRLRYGRTRPLRLTDAPVGGD